MPAISVTRVETRPHQTFGVVLGRCNGVSSYVMVPRDDVEVYADELAAGRELKLDFPAWKICKVSEGFSWLT